MAGYHSIAHLAYSRCGNQVEASDPLAKQKRKKKSPVAPVAAPSPTPVEPVVPTEPATVRLVIRAEIIRDEPREAPAPRLHKRALAAGIAALAVLATLVWFGIGAFRSDSPSSSRTTEEPRTAASQPSPRAATATAPASLSRTDPPPATAATQSAPTTQVEATALRTPSDEHQVPTLPESLNEVIPEPAPSALQTVRGTIRVTIRVAIDKQGAVVAARSQNAGPSRYFERLSLEAARQWTFRPTNAAEPQTALLRFSFTRDGATARVEPPR